MREGAVVPGHGEEPREQDQDKSGRERFPPTQTPRLTPKENKSGHPKGSGPDHHRGKKRSLTWRFRTLGGVWTNIGNAKVTPTHARSQEKRLSLRFHRRSVPTIARIKRIPIPRPKVPKELAQI
jgi:hypothetical protein